MDKQAAVRLVEDTFGSEFSEDKFQRFISNLLKKFQQKPLPGQHRVRTGNLIYEPYRDFIESLSRVGKYTDSGDRSVEILVATLCPGISTDRARTKQRNFIAWYLENGRDDGTRRDAALVAFVPQDRREWRFSLVRMEYELTRTAEGKTKGTKTISPARRFSFLVGEGENTHTAKARFLPLMEDDSHQPTLEDLSRAFSVETITEEFFERYRELVEKVDTSLQSIVKRDKVVREEFREKGIQTIDFAKKLLGQIVFLYFIQKKGWLGVKRDDKWGSGPKNFLRKLFDGEVISYKNFFNDVLEYLFYDMLAQDKGELAWRGLFKCRVPFLNGGLFEPLYDYDWEKTEIVILNEIFSNRRCQTDFDSGDGILDVFDRYNFTVKEDEPLEKAVAIDPELLGKVFENLLEQKDRKSKGSYYTPREVVHYMCQESLISYLHGSLKGQVTREDLSEFIKYGELNVYNDARVAREGRETERYSYKLPEAVRHNASEIDELLKEIKICDPAVGSGAFPMGMINEIVRARWTLNPVLCSGRTEGIKGREEYDFKWHAVENSIYGVDLDPGAVEIAKLRLWLSLVVDEESLDKIQPLPNLDFKIMQGNSLLDELKGRKLFDKRLFGAKDPIEQERGRLNQKLSALQREYARLTREEPGELKKSDLPARIEAVALRLQKLKKAVTKEEERRLDLFSSPSDASAKLTELHTIQQQFFKAWHKSEKEKLRRRIEQVDWELIEATLKDHKETEALEELRKSQADHAKPFFLWHLHFYDVFEEKGGFDIVIANPPYVRQEKLSSGDQEGFARSFPEVHKGTADILVYFYALAIRLLRDGGAIAFITSNKYMRAGYGDKIREHLGRSLEIRQVIDFADLPVFEVIAYPAVVLGTKTEVEEDHQCTVVDLCRPITRIIESRGASVHTREVREELRNLESLIAENGIHDFPQVALRKEGWVLEDSRLLALFEKMKGEGPTLGEFTKGKMYRGVLTGLNEAFVIDEQTRKSLIAADRKSAELIKPWLRGKDVKRWRAEWAGLYIIAVQSSGDADCSNPWKEAKTEKEAREIFRRSYPAVYEHLMTFEEYPDPKNPKKKIGLRPRLDQGRYFWELRACKYYHEFESAKITFASIAPEPRFMFDDSGFYSNDKTQVLVNVPSAYVAVFNSRAFFMIAAATSLAQRQGGFYEWKQKYMENLPLPALSQQAQRRLVEIERTLRKGANAALEEETESLVREGYGLSKVDESLIDKWLEQHSSEGVRPEENDDSA